MPVSKRLIQKIITLARRLNRWRAKWELCMSGDYCMRHERQYEFNPCNDWVCGACYQEQVQDLRARRAAQEAIKQHWLRIVKGEVEE